jgi:preprotein translocase subunit SecG
MHTAVFVFHIILCLLLVGLVLLQQGKGADIGAAFGGGSNTLFGAVGANAVMVKITTAIAVLFMATSIYLVRSYSQMVLAGPTKMPMPPLQAAQDSQTATAGDGQAVTENKGENKASVNLPEMSEGSAAAGEGNLGAALPPPAKK